jgi:hypothetical protein
MTEENCRKILFYCTRNLLKEHLIWPKCAQEDQFCHEALGLGIFNASSVWFTKLKVKGKVVPVLN